MNIRVIKTAKKAKQAETKFQLENKLDDHKNSEDHFRLEDAFVNRYRNKKANFGFNGLGELVFYRTYSRPLPHNPKQKESFCDTVKRVVEGCYEIQRRHSVKIHVPWDYKKAQNSAQEMFQRIWDFKFLPPGRGLWMMGTEFMWTRGSAALNNCGFVSTVDVDSEPAEPFCFLMDMSMLGVGVGFDTKGAGKLLIKRPSDNTFTHVVDDSREGWVESLRILINSYSTNNRDGTPEFDYSKIRKEDEPIKGFGGKAAGPGILMNLHQMFRNHFDSKIGQSLDSVDIVDLMNYIGKCVVAGNVRRCLPKGTLIHLKRGLTPIEQVQVGDLVLTADGYHPVAENVQQGIQNVITINSQLGQFRCTEKHRIAVMTGIGEYGWKRANQLKPGDKMVFVDSVIPGTATVLPGYSDMSTRGTKLAIPGLTGDVSWFIGMIHGDGYVYNGRRYKNKKRHGASIAVAFNRDQYHDAILEKVKEGFGSFGFTPRDHKSNDNCHKLRVTSSKLSEYFFKNFKKARKPLDVPECIRLGTPEIRSAYLAGLLDSDGSTKNRPTTLVSSVYKNFIRQVQAVYSSLGIPTKLKLRCEAEGNSQAKWELSLVGEFAIKKFLEIIQPWAVKQLRETAHSGHDFGFPSSWINRETVDYGRSWSPNQSQMTYNRAVLCEVQTKSLIPVEIESIVDEGVAVETYDLSVPDRSEFVAEGLLVHNTAEIAFGEYDDEQYSSMKNCMKTLLPEDYSKWYQVTGRLYSESAKNNTQVAAQLNDFIDNETFVIPVERLAPAIEVFNKLNSHRWASNNSIFAKVGMDYTNVAQQIQVNGEPGLIYLDNVRDYGRMIDGKRPGIDGRVAGSNPCVEQSLESYELCNLVETFPANHENAEDYMRTLKFAYLYAKTVTLLPTHNARTNQVTLRNRRIGLSQSGIIQAFAKFGRRAVLQDFCDAGYNEIKRWDNIYSEWLCVTQSIKVTSVKPSGCRPWHALTTTSGGILTLEELFEVSGHQIDQQWCDMPDGLFAVQGDSNLRPITSEDESNICVATVTDRITKTYDNGISDIVTIKLSHNIELESTPNHQWFVSHRYVRSKKHRYELCNKWKRADQIEPDDVIHVEPGVYESFEHSKLIKLGNRSVVMRGGKSYNIKQPTAMNPDLAWLLGYMWGDGSQSYSKYRMRYSDEHLFNLHKAQRIILDQFGLETSIKPASQGRNSYQLEVGSKELWHWLLINDCLKIKSNHDLVPKCVRASGHEDIIAFLAGLCDSDGCIGRRHNDQYAILTMAGKMFAKHIQDVALTVGIVFSRSLNSAGENFQQEKSMWSLSSMKTTLKDRFEYFKKHCNKVQEKSADVPWSHELGQPSRILGKVLKIGKGVRQRTYDVEVENSHWYYAGAVKSHNTVSLLVGATPGIHNPEARHYWRRVRIAKNNPLVKILADAGYHIEPVISDPERTVVVKFAVSDSRVKPVGETTIWEQMANAIDYQRYWADNQVSCTVKFKSSEVDQIKLVLETYEDQIKGISFLPFSDHGYAQAPYEPCTEQEVLDYNARIKSADYSSYILEAVGSSYCDNDSCELPQK